MSREDNVPQVGAGHYAALCALFLTLIFLVQLQSGLLLTNLFAAMVGALALIYRLRLGPILLVAMVAVAQIALQIGVGRDVGPSPQRALQLSDVILCAAVLGYVACHYRLQGIWYQLLPTDVRQRQSAPRRRFPWLRRKTPVLKEKRSAGQITAREVAWLVATLPVWAALAQLVWALFPQQWTIVGPSTELGRILLALWLLTVGFWVIGTLLDFWKLRRHEPATAQLYLQDLLWRDTRGEQRRVNRWLAWWKLARKINSVG